MKFKQKFIKREQRLEEKYNIKRKFIKQSKIFKIEIKKLTIK